MILLSADIVTTDLCMIAISLVVIVLAFHLMRCLKKMKDVESDRVRLRRLADIINDSTVMLIFDKDENLKFVNEAFHRLYDMTEDVYRNKIGKSLSDYLKWSGFEKFDRKTDTSSFIGKSKSLYGEEIWKQVSINKSIDENGDTLFVLLELDITNVKQAEMELQQQKKRSDELLLNMLPAEIVEELKAKGSASPRVYKNASVLFADIKDFTQWSERLNPTELIDTLQDLFSDFDDVLARNYIEKIKTIGDAYMCAGGLPMKNNSHPFDIVIAAFGLQAAVRKLDEKRAREGGEPWLMRIGINTGPVVTGVVGKIRTVYDIWGDSVNTASRLESECEPGKVNISASTYEVIKDYFECEYRGKVPAKHKGEIDMYFVNRLKPEYSADKDGFVPNDKFESMLASL